MRRWICTSPLNNSRPLLPIREQKKFSASLNPFCPRRITELSLKPEHCRDVRVLRFGSSRCHKRSKAWERFQDQGECSVVDALRLGLNSIYRLHSFLGAFLWDRDFARNWFLVSGLCAFKCLDPSICCKFAEPSALRCPRLPEPKRTCCVRGLDLLLPQQPCHISRRKIHLWREMYSRI